MDHAKKLEFIHKMTKMGLEHVQHFDGGGTVLGGPANPAANNIVNSGSGIAAALGLNNSFQANGANIQAGTNNAQLNQAYTDANNALDTQAGQTAVLNPQVQTAAANEATLANQFSDQAQGLGPNVAKSQLAQATGQNVANQAALMAGQRGASSNVGLLAKQAAEQGAATQQAAVGQGATLQAQQSIAAQQQQAQLAAQQIAQAQAAANSGVGAQQGEQQILQGANTATNNANVAMQSNINNTNAAIAAGNQAAGGKAFGAIAGGIGSALGLAKGGKVKKMAEGGAAVELGTGKRIPPDPDAGSHDGVISSWLGLANGGSVCEGPHKSHVANFLAAGGKATNKKVPAMLSPGEKYLSPEEVKKVMLQGANPLKMGKAVPGKAKVKGDSLKNDVVPATLEEGGLVLPRHIMNGMSREKAELFVHKSMAKKGQRK